MMAKPLEYDTKRPLSIFKANACSVPSPSRLTLIKKLEETWKKTITPEYIKRSSASVIERLQAIIDADGGHIEGIRHASVSHEGTDDDSDKLTQIISLYVIHQLSNYSTITYH